MASLCTRQALVFGASDAQATAVVAAGEASSRGAGHLYGRWNTASVRSVVGRRRRTVSILSSRFRGVLLPGFCGSSSSSFQHKAVWKSPADALSPRAAALVQKVTATELDSILTNERNSALIIDFYATWCGPCVVLAQRLETLALEYGGDVRFLKVDTDEEHELAAEMDIRGLPTMVFVSKDVDKLAIRIEGLLPDDTIRNIIEKEL